MSYKYVSEAIPNQTISVVTDDLWTMQALRLFPAAVIVPIMQICWTLFSIINGGPPLPAHVAVSCDDQNCVSMMPTCRRQECATWLQA